MPEGSILGPSLFIMYINDLPNCMTNSNCLMYADDSKVFRLVKSVKDCELLQADINSLSNWCKIWKNDLNIKKCKIIYFSFL